MPARGLPALAVLAALTTLIPASPQGQQRCDFLTLPDGAATANDFQLFAERVRQRQPTLLLNATGSLPATRAWRSLAALAARYGDLQLPVRKPASTARGQSFRRASKHMTLSSWVARLKDGGAPPLVFDTNGSSGIFARTIEDIRPLPSGLLPVLKTSLFSLAGEPYSNLLPAAPNFLCIPCFGFSPPAC